MRYAILIAALACQIAVGAGDVAAKLSDLQNLERRSNEEWKDLVRMSGFKKKEDNRRAENEIPPMFAIENLSDLKNLEGKSNEEWQDIISSLQMSRSKKKEDYRMAEKERMSMDAIKKSSDLKNLEGKSDEEWQDIISSVRKEENRRAEKERRSMDTIENLSDRLQNLEGKSNEDWQQKFKEKRIRLDEMHGEVSDTLADHHEGRELLSDKDLEQHTRRKAQLGRNKRSLEEEAPEKFNENERMERQKERELEWNEQLAQKLEWKKKIHADRFKREEEAEEL